LTDCNQNLSSLPLQIIESDITIHFIEKAEFSIM
jgi:hypothetical protein